MSKKQIRINKLIQLANALGSPCDTFTKDSAEVVSHAVFTIDRRNQIILHIESMLKDEGISAVSSDSKVNED